jgi:superfamily II DNA or RNA helicase
VPFAYHGVRDDIDYDPIPWRNHRFDPAALAAAVQTHARMERLWRAWHEHPGTRTLVFCCSIDHARFAAAWLAERGGRVASVFAAPGSADRSAAVTQLLRGELDALCVVDIFNEGVDLPALDRVVMLRPTESAVIFLQQLGRGLRRYEGKERLTVIDFVGNHRIFLDRLRRLLSLVSSPTSLRAYLESDAPPQLPPGCSVDLELEAKQLLREAC